MDIFGIYNLLYRIIYSYIVFMFLWSIFTHKEFVKQIGFTIVIVPFLLRLIGIK